MLEWEVTIYIISFLIYGYNEVYHFIYLIYFLEE